MKKPSNTSNKSNLVFRLSDHTMSELTKCCFYVWSFICAWRRTIPPFSRSDLQEASDQRTTLALAGLSFRRAFWMKTHWHWVHASFCCCLHGVLTPWKKRGGKNASFLAAAARLSARVTHVCFFLFLFPPSWWCDRGFSLPRERFAFSEWWKRSCGDAAGVVTLLEHSGGESLYRCFVQQIRIICLPQRAWCFCVRPSSLLPPWLGCVSVCESRAAFEEGALCGAGWLGTLR